MTRISDADKYIDLITALEACFTKISHEARYRLALSCAAVLNRSFTVYKTMLRLYKRRSDIIHGKIETDNIKDDLKQLESYSLSVVRYFLAELAYGNAKKLEAVNEQIDKMLLPEP